MNLSTTVRRALGTAALTLGLALAVPAPALAAEGWYQKDGSWRYEQADGTDATGWISWANKSYYLKADGNMVTGWQFVDGAWYYFGTSGAMKTGWIWDGSAWYYLSEEASTIGHMAASQWATDGSWVAGNGAWVPGIHEDDGPRDLTIIHTNDVHGYDQLTDTSLGIAAVAQLKEDYKALGGDVLLLDAGDNMQGNILVNISKGMNAVKFMNASGYDAMALGNHEFDYGQDQLKSYIKEANYPVLSANVIEDATGKTFVETNTTFTMQDGKKVGVFGLTTPNTKTSSAPRNTVGLSFRGDGDLYKCAQEQIDELRAAGCDFVVCLGHLGEEEADASSNAKDVVANTSGLDLFIDGHDHEVENQVVNDLHGKGVTITETGCYLANVGVVHVSGKPDNVTLFSKGSLTNYDETVNAMVEAAVAEVENEMGQQVATTDYALNGERDPGNRTEETNLGDLVTDAVLWAANQVASEPADLCILNGGAIRNGCPAGPITLKDVRNFTPFENSLCMITITGAQLLETLEASTFCTPEALGAFPQVAGVEFTLDTTKEYVKGEQYPNSSYYAPAAPGTRVTIKSVGGKPFDLNATYRLATIEFIAEGGDTYVSLGSAAASTETLDMLDWVAVEYYLETGLGGVVPEQYAAPQGRIEIIS